MGIVHEAVEDRIGEGWVSDPGMPLRDRELARDQGRGVMVAVVEQLQKVVTLGLGELADAEVVEDGECPEFCG